MKKTILLLNVILLSLLFSSCESEEITTTQTTQVEDKNAINKKAMAFDLLNLLQNKKFKTKVIDALSNDHTPGIKLSKILKENDYISNHKSYTSLKTATDRATNNLKSTTIPDAIEIPELWLQKPKDKSVTYDTLLVSFAPEGDEKFWSKIEAYTLDGQLVYLDSKNTPNVPVIVIETKGFEALKAEVNHMNKQLQNKGLQNNRFESAQMDLIPFSKSNNGLETTKLDQIKLNNNEEPWISGAAEIYAITSGIKNNNNEAEIKIIPMYYLEDEDTTYYPNQIMLFWQDYQYEAANIQFFEKDDNYNFKQLIETIVNGIFKIAGSVTEESWVHTLGQVASIILQAMPDKWFANNDDYVDSLYTIEKNKTYKNYKGAQGNATVTLSPLFISEN